MAFRPSAEIRIILRAIDQATAQIRRVKGEGQSLGTSFSTLGRMAQIAGGMIVADLAMRASDAIHRFVRESIEQFGRFEATLNKVVASSGETGLAAERLRDDIREAALAAGREFGVGATQATAAMEALVKAGMKGEQAITALKGTLMMATIEEMNTAEAAKYVVQSLGMFGKSADDATQMVDILTNASIKGVDTVREYAIGLGYCGKTMHTYGMSAEEAAAALVALNNQGIQAEKAGRYLDAMFRDLIEHSDKLGFEIYDAAGQMFSMDEIIHKLITKMSEFATEQERNAYLAEAFGTQGRRAVLALMDMTYEGEKGAEAFRLLAEAMGVSGSSAMYFARMADTQEMALKRMNAALEEARIELGAALSPAIQAFAQFVIDEVVPAIKEFSDDIDNLVWLFGKLGEAVKPVTDALQPLTSALEGASGGAFDLTNVLLMLGGPSGANLAAVRTSMDLTDQLRSQEAQERLAAVAAGELALSAEELWDVIKRVDEATGDDTRELEEWVREQREAAGVTHLTTEELCDQYEAMVDARQGGLNLIEATKEAEEAQITFAKSIGSTDEEFADLAERMGLAEDELRDFILQTGIGIDELKVFAEQMDTIKKSFFDVFTEESREFQIELEAVGRSVYNVLSGMEPDFAAAHSLIQEFADRWGLTWEEAEKLVSAKVGDIKEAVTTIPQTFEEELVGKAQDAMERFKECMSEKSTATKEETRRAMEDMVSTVNELISHGLLGEAQALMDEFKQHEPDKMWTMVEDIDEAIETLTREMESNFEEMLATADTLSGEERDLLIDRAEQMRDEYLARIEQLEEWRSQVLLRMKLETQGYTQDETNTIMSALTELKNLSGAKWNEMANEWDRTLNRMEGDVNAAIDAIQAKINSLRGKTITVTTRYQEVYERYVRTVTGTSGGETRMLTTAETQALLSMCFLPGTKILMGNGSEKDIENVEAGDLVRSWNLSKSEVTLSYVAACFRGEAKGFYILNERIMVTGEHPFFTHAGWKRAKNLRKGDLLFRERLGFSERLTSIVYVDKKVKVYNFCVVPKHNYFADGVLVHNKPLTITPEGVVVLTQAEAAMWRGGLAQNLMERAGRGRGGDTYVFNLPNAVLSSDIGIRETAARLAKYEAQERRRRGLGT